MLEESKMEIYNFCYDLPDAIRVVELIDRINDENPKAELTYDITCGPNDLETPGERMMAIRGTTGSLGFLRKKLFQTDNNVATLNKVIKNSGSFIPGNLKPGETSRPVGNDSYQTNPEKTPRDEFEELLKEFNLGEFISLLHPRRDV
jgi:hypothetical protein